MCQGVPLNERAPFGAGCKSRETLPGQKNLWATSGSGSFPMSAECVAADELSDSGTRVIVARTAYRLLLPSSSRRKACRSLTSVLAGNTQDKATLRDCLARIDRQYGKADRIWVMNRGIPTEEVLQEMRACDPPVQYLVGTPKGRLAKFEKQLLDKPWHEARPGVHVKLLPQEGELYVLRKAMIACRRSGRYASGSSGGYGSGTRNSRRCGSRARSCS
jgi:hypothetical protein